ncbi:MAG: cyclic nucleotide-binding domain-containing protein [Bacteroidia bacterium]|nr:cyclic nucleotide-binding domain-containing protein [Bacteroidia bacterium]
MSLPRAGLKGDSSIFIFGLSMRSNNILATLQNSSLFSGLKKEDLEAISHKTKVRQYFPNDMIVWQGQPSKTLYFIMNGIVAVKSLVRGKENILAYLISGNTFGEVGILENQPRSASVMAVSEVDVLVIQREHFLEIMHKHSKVAIELARILGHYLLQSNRRLTNENKDLQMILLLNAQDRTGSTTLGTLMAKELAETRKTLTAYLEYPIPTRLLKGQQIPHNRTVFTHADGYDILFPEKDEHLPIATQTTILMDKIKQQYSNIVVNIHGKLDDAIYGMLEDATQVIVLSHGTREGLKDVQYLVKELKRNIRVEETSVFTLLTQIKNQEDFEKAKDAADYVVPYMKDFPTFRLQEPTETYPEEISEVVAATVDRLERTNSIGIYIPSTINGNQHFDSSNQREEALKFMAERFGGATCKMGTGVWNSERMGLVGESVYIIHSYITQPDLNRYLDEVIDFMRDMKKELKQEAMALEINRKLTLI